MSPGIESRQQNGPRTQSRDFYLRMYSTTTTSSLSNFIDKPSLWIKSIAKTMEQASALRGENNGFFH